LKDCTFLCSANLGMLSGHVQVRHLIEDFWKNLHLQSGYQLLYTPHIAKASVAVVQIMCKLQTPDHYYCLCQVDLWKTSGHFDFYRESMFNQMDVDADEYQASCFSCDPPSVLCLTHIKSPSVV
jgi:threonyl-tRNA synthetase